LQSRYYNPELGRFLNADKFAATGQGLLGYNMFAYCNNSPVQSVDHTGEGPIAIGVLGEVLISLAKAAAATAAVAAGVAIVKKSAKQRQKSHTIYTLSDPTTNQVTYVGRTTDIKTRMKAHSLNPARRKLTATVLHEGLTYEQARAAEQAYILYYSTLDKNNKSSNQINGVNPNRKDYLSVMQNGFGVSEAVDSVLTNKLLILFE